MSFRIFGDYTQVLHEAYNPDLSALESADAKTGGRGQHHFLLDFYGFGLFNVGLSPEAGSGISAVFDFAGVALASVGVTAGMPLSV
jgi:hypothetical protein